MRQATVIVLLTAGLAGCSFDAAPLDDRRCLNDEACVQSNGPGYRCLAVDGEDGGYCIEFQETCEDPLEGDPGDGFCDDGIFCNGDEICDLEAAGADERGCLNVDRVVDDGVACTEDYCDEENDVVLNLDHGCQCTREGGDRQCAVLLGGPCVASATCNMETLTCDVTLTAEGEACDDGVACTKDTSCDGSGVCGTGTNDDTECNDDVFCNGVETCDPGAEGATSDGCAAGVLVAQDPMYDDGNECTQTFCDEDTQSVVHGPTLDCDCRTPDDCRAASPDDACGIFECDTGTGFTCQRVQGMFEDPGVVCDDQVPCTGNDVCQPDGQCEGTPSAAFCAVSSPDAICAPDSDQADEDGCATP